MGLTWERWNVDVDDPIRIGCGVIVSKMFPISIEIRVDFCSGGSWNESPFGVMSNPHHMASSNHAYVLLRGFISSVDP